ncbi:MAG TPA: DUF1565 domain-containing protein [Candidatus Eisenbacteria bacterium]|nr:DUF1565 domain-containing protein [Candidatus Eisenbacteria bacterium]
MSRFLSPFRIAFRFTAGLAALAGGLAAPALAGTWYVSPTGNDANIGSATQPLATIGRADQMAQPGDVVHVANGIYADFPVPARSGGSAGRITFIGNLADPQKVVVTPYGTMSRSDVTLAGFDLRGGFRLNGDRDSIAWCAAEGGKSEISASNDCVMAHCILHAERFWMVGSETDTTVKSLRDSLRDCVFVLSPAGAGGHTVRFQMLEQAWVERCRFQLDIAAAAIDASATKYFFVKHCRFVDCSWDITARCTSGCDEQGWFVLRDVTQHNTFTRDSITLRGPGSMQLFASASGSYPGSVIHNVWDHCVVRQIGPSAYGAAMMYQDQAQSDTLIGCLLVGQQAGLGFNSGVHEVLVDHCTIAGFGPAQGSLNMNNNASWTSANVQNSIVCTVAGSGTGAAPLVASLASAQGHLAADHNLYYGPVSAGAAISITGLGSSGVGSGTPWCSQVGADCHSQFAAPVFENTSSVLAFDGMPSANSPAIGASSDGSDLGAVPYDDTIRPAPVRDLRVQSSATPATVSPLGGKGTALPHGAQPGTSPTAAATGRHARGATPAASP